jgi:hypothetical protein
LTQQALFVTHKALRFAASGPGKAAKIFWTRFPRILLRIFTSSVRQMYTARETLKKNIPADQTAPRVAVIAVNPYLLHVYWQVSEWDLENIAHTLRESLATARPVLRFYDITCILFDGMNAHQIFDVEVDLRTMKWNVPIWSADKSYVIDLGYKGSDGRFYQIGRSNVVNVPRAEPSPQLAERDLRVEQGQIRSLVPVRLADVQPRKPVEAPRLETIHGMRKDTGMPLKVKAEPIDTPDSASTKDKPKEAGIVPCHVSETETREEEGAVREVYYPFDLVDLTLKRFSFGVSSLPPTQGTNP